MKITLDILTKFSLGLLFGLLHSCSNSNSAKQTTTFYFVSYGQDSYKVDTAYIKDFDRNIKDLELVAKVGFPYLKSGVTKYASYGGPTDSQYLCYYTDEFGIIFTKNITWGNFSRLHCTNDSIEKKINIFFDFIVSRQSLVLAGEDFAKYGDSTLMLGSIRQTLKK